MKILIDLTALADNFSGIERYAASIAYEMVSVDNKTEYILLFKEKVHSMFEAVIMNNNVTHYILPRRNKLFFNQVTLPIAINRLKADWYLFMAFPVPVFLFKKHMVTTIHDICAWDCPDTMNGLSSVYFRLSFRIAMVKCSNIITISEFSQKRIIERFNYNESKIWLIYCGIDEKFKKTEYSRQEQIDIQKKYNLPEEYILSLSTIEPRKNIQLLIRAYAELVSENVDIPPLVLAGRKGWIKEEIFKGLPINVKDKINFTGFIDECDLPYVYRKARLFVFPSKYEGFGIPPLEALASGTLVVSSDAASLPEILGNDALYFKSDDLNGLKTKLKSALTDETHVKDNRSSLFSWRREACKLLGKMNCNLEIS